MRAIIVALLTVGVLVELVLRAALLVTLTVFTLGFFLATANVPTFMTITLLPVLRTQVARSTGAIPAS